jgi:hypothetical protein
MKLVYTIMDILLVWGKKFTIWKQYEYKYFIGLCENDLQESLRTLQEMSLAVNSTMVIKKIFTGEQILRV